jgi:hypothetical protein
LTSLEKLIGLPGYQVTGIEEEPGMFRISVRHEGTPSCLDCGNDRLRLKDKRMRHPRHDSWG